MTCDVARELILEADPEALRGRGGSELASHVRACPQCAAAAAAVLRANHELNASLTAPVDPVAVDAILSRLEGPEPARVRGAPGKPARSVVRWRRTVWASLALAAAAAGIVFVVARAPGPVPRVASDVTAAEPPVVPLVEETGTATVAVIPTDDPDITVIWFF